jgi:hypothetical protein
VGLKCPLKSNLIWLVDPVCHFDADANSDPACQFDADPDPTFHFGAVPDPEQNPSFQIKAQNRKKVPCL